jgi:hypothetical protein
MLISKIIEVETGYTNEPVQMATEAIEKQCAH